VKFTPISISCFLLLKFTPMISSFILPPEDLLIAHQMYRVSGKEVKTIEKVRLLRLIFIIGDFILLLIFTCCMTCYSSLITVKPAPPFPCKRLVVNTAVLVNGLRLGGWFFRFQKLRWNFE
jgi:hypothetical protein